MEKKDFTIFVHTSGVIGNENVDFQPGITETGVKDQLKKMISGIKELSEDTLDLVSLSIARISKRIILKLDEQFDDRKPSTVSIEYGINIASETSIEIVKASGEATFTVLVEWHKE